MIMRTDGLPTLGRQFVLEDGVPDAVRRAYHVQRHAAKKRGLGFEFTLAQWWAWWQVDGRWDRRGTGHDRLVMARLSDGEPYREGNVKCITHRESIAELSRALPHTRREVGFCGCRGDSHPKSRAVLTPDGRFGSAALAAEHFGRTRQYISRLARTKKDGFSYEAD